MSAFRSVCAACLPILFLGACSTPYPGYSVTPLDGDTALPYVQLSKALQESQGGNPPLLDRACFASVFPANAAVSAIDCAGLRNQAVSALVIGSADACLRHRRSMYGNEAAWNIGLGTLTNLFAGAASVVTAEKSKSILAALALFSNSERSLVNETVYKQMLVTAVDRKIVETRDVKMQAIHASLAKDIAAYPVSQALEDVIALHNSCSFIDGLQKALHEGTQDTPTLRLARLQGRLQALKAELDSVDPQKAGNRSHIDGLTKRIAALHAAALLEDAR